MSNISKVPEDPFIMTVTWKDGQENVGNQIKVNTYTNLHIFTFTHAYAYAYNLHIYILFVNPSYHEEHMSKHIKTRLMF